MSNKTTAKAPHPHMFVSLHMLRDGEVEVLVTGRHGSLTLTAYGEDPTFAIRDEKRQFLGVCGLQANGRFKGWLARVDKEGQKRLEWFPAKPARTRTRAKARKKG
jgi:hypothetical protein